MSEKSIISLAKAMDDAGVTEYTEETSILWGLVRNKTHLSKQQIIQAGAPVAPVSQAVAAPAGAAKKPGKEPEAQSDGEVVTSPMVGVVYFSAEPGSPKYIEIGKTVAAGDTLCVVEAMKTFNPIKAPKGGVITEMLVKDGDTVEFGTKLVVIN